MTRVETTPTGTRAPAATSHPLFTFDATIEGMRPRRLLGATSNAALAAAIEGVIAARAQFDALWDVHAAAEEHERDMLQKHGSPRPPYNGMPVANAKPDPEPPEYAAAVQAAKKADRAQMRAWNQVDKAARAMLDVYTPSLPDSLLKQRAYAWANEGERTDRLSCDEDVRTALSALLRDVAALAGDPTIPPADQPAPSSRSASEDAALLALGEKFEASWAEQRAYDAADSDEGYNQLTARTSAIGACIVQIPATTIEGLRVKARVAQECQTDDPAEPFELTTYSGISDSRVAQIIVNDLLGLKERPEDARRADEEREREASMRGRLRGMRAYTTDEVEAWEAARDAFIQAKAANDGIADDDSIEGREAFLSTCRALLTYAQMPVPDLRRLATMMTDVLNFDGLQEAGDKADDPASIQALLDDDDAPTNYLAMVYQHVRRLIGSPGAIDACRRALPTERGETDQEFLTRLRTLAAEKVSIHHHAA